MKFILSAAAGAVGVLVTLIFIPEITSLDLKEGDTRWDMMKKGIGNRSPGYNANCQHTFLALILVAWETIHHTCGNVYFLCKGIADRCWEQWNV